MTKPKVYPSSKDTTAARAMAHLAVESGHKKHQQLLNDRKEIHDFPQSFKKQVKDPNFKWDGDSNQVTGGYVVTSGPYAKEHDKKFILNKPEEFQRNKENLRQAFLNKEKAEIEDKKVRNIEAKRELESAIKYGGGHNMQQHGEGKPFKGSK